MSNEPIFSVLSGKDPCTSESIQNYLQSIGHATCEGVSRVWEAYGPNATAQDCVDETIGYGYTELEAQQICCSCNY